MSSAMTEYDSWLFGIGEHYELYHKLGAHPEHHDGVSGTRFAVWAPNARSVSVVGDFNAWQGHGHRMSRDRSSGVHELFVAGVGPGSLYKFQVEGADGSTVMKCDPVGFAMELRPANASIVTELAGFPWQDEAWCRTRPEEPWTAPLNVYEVHPGSWKRVAGEGGVERMMSWRELAADLVPYVREAGFTHIELMGVAEHPLDASWGYQVVGYFAPTARHGTPQDFMYFVDACHQAGIGVILDWVPAHFPKDAHGLSRFDGTALYEYADPRVGEHREWGTRVFDYGQPQVRNFLVANALFWFDVYHVDGLRVDAVASMLYLDYSRDDGMWIANRHGGRENLEAIQFLQHLNETVRRYHPSAMMIAEESTAFPDVTRDADRGGLGFRFKWNMGWMNDTLRYMALDPVHRSANCQLVTFSLMYAWSENYLLALSHDEFVHGKGSLVGRMPGNEFWRLAQVRLYLTMQAGHPGKQLLFMGCEIGQHREWSEARSLDWHLLEDAGHAGLLRYVHDLNALYRANAACWQLDADPHGFSWLKVDDHAQSVYAFARFSARADEGPARDGGGEDTLLFVFNFTPVAREGYRLPAPAPGRWRVLLSSDAARYGGSEHYPQPLDVETSGPDTGSGEGASAELCLDLPPLCALVLRGPGSS